ncbi:PKD domain-containing protein [Methanochimaera problematica]|nr:PKD domain-containing protein [Methanoplanus sp. FWC-SCC4]
MVPSVSSLQTGWNFTIVDNGNSGSLCSLAYNPVTKNPAILYTDSEGKHLYYRYYDEGWQEPLDTGILATGSISFDFDESGNGHCIGYSVNQTLSRGKIYYSLIKDGRVESTEMIDNNVGVLQSISIKAVQDQTPYISFSNISNKLSLYKREDENWFSFFSSSYGDSSGQFSSLSINPATKMPSIVYSYSLYGINKIKLIYAEFDGEKWSEKSVKNSEGYGFFCSLDLNSSGNPSISYTRSFDKSLYYAFRAGGVWTNQIVDGSRNIDIPGYTSLDFDSSDCPHISYYNTTSHDLMLASKNISDEGSLWKILPLYSEGDSGMCSSLKINPESDLPSVAFVSDNKLMFAEEGFVPKSSFDASPLSPVLGEETHFSISSETEETKYSWDFGDGSVSGEETPSHLYKNPGIYDVSMSAKSRFGESVTEKTGYIIVKPYANFHAGKTTGTGNLTVSFFDDSKGASAWNWSFGDGEWFNTTDEGLKNPVHSYEIPGFYDVTLIASNGSLKTEIIKNGYIVVSSITEKDLNIEAQSPLGDAGNRDTNVMSAKKLNAGDSVSFSLNKGSLSEFSFFTQSDLTEILITIKEEKNLPAGIPDPRVPVYRYETPEVFRADKDQVSSPEYEFKIPKSWMDENDLIPADILCLSYECKTNEWKSFQTVYTCFDGENCIFKAKTYDLTMIALGGKKTCSQNTDKSSDEKPVLEDNSVLEKPADKSGGGEMQSTRNPPGLMNTDLKKMPLPLFLNLAAIFVFLIFGFFSAKRNKKR